MESIIDATNAIVGRLSTVVAKRALLGDKIIIVNSEKAVISGGKDFTIAEFHHRVSIGTPSKGPFYPRRSDMLLRRMIRGMLPYKQARGAAAFKRITCYVGLPDEFREKKLEQVKIADASKLLLAKTTSLEQISNGLGKKFK